MRCTIQVSLFDFGFEGPKLAAGISRVQSTTKQQTATGSETGFCLEGGRTEKNTRHNLWGMQKF